MEKSLRYCEGNPEFYIPNQDTDLYERAYNSAWQYYNWLLLNQTDKEVARSVLPIGIYTEYYFPNEYQKPHSYVVIENGIFCTKRNTSNRKGNAYDSCRLFPNCWQNMC